MVYEIQTIIRLMIETWMIVLWMIVSYPFFTCYFLSLLLLQPQSAVLQGPNGQASFSPSQVVSCALVRSISLDVAN